GFAVFAGSDDRGSNLMHAQSACELRCALERSKALFPQPAKEIGVLEMAERVNGFLTWPVIGVAWSQRNPSRGQERQNPVLETCHRHSADSPNQGQTERRARPCA